MPGCESIKIKNVISFVLPFNIQNRLVKKKKEWTFPLTLLRCNSSCRRSLWCDMCADRVVSFTPSTASILQTPFRAVRYLSLLIVSSSFSRRHFFVASRSTLIHMCSLTLPRENRTSWWTSDRTRWIRATGKMYEWVRGEGSITRSKAGRSWR